MKNILLIIVQLFNSQVMNLSENIGIFSINVNKNAKCYAENSIEINASGETIYKTLTEVNLWTNWMSAVKSAHLNGDALPEKDFKWNADGMSIVSKFHTIIPHKAVGWSGKTLWFKAIHNWEIIEKDGKTVVKVCESMEGIGSGFIKKSLEEGMAKSLIELKNRAESIEINKQ